MAESDRQPRYVFSQIKDDLIEKQLTCCQTKTAKVFVCVNCANVFHLSCAVKNKHVKKSVIMENNVLLKHNINLLQEKLNL